MAEKKTSCLTGIEIDGEITKAEHRLQIIYYQLSPSDRAYSKRGKVISADYKRTGKKRMHAFFIRGLLDPTECELLKTADGFADEYCRLLEEAGRQECRAEDRVTEKSLELTKRYRDFKAAGAEGITDCRIRSIILPLLADHVLREANHYLRILGSGENGTC